MKKKTLIPIVLAAIAITACGTAGGTTVTRDITQTKSLNEQEKIDEKEVKKAYKEYFKSREGKITVAGVDKEITSDNCDIGASVTIEMKKLDGYEITDIDENGIPELIMFDNAESDDDICSYRLMLCTYENSEVKPIFAVKGMRDGAFLATDGRICAHFGGSDFDENAFYKLDGTKVAYEGMYYALGKGRKAGYEDSKVFKSFDGEITEAEYDKYLEENILRKIGEKDTADNERALSELISKIKFEDDFSDKELSEIKEGHYSWRLEPEDVIIDFVEKNNLSDYLKHTDDGLAYKNKATSKNKKTVTVDCEGTDAKLEIILVGTDIGNEVMAWRVESCEVTHN